MFIAFRQRDRFARSAGFDLAALGLASLLALTIAGGAHAESETRQVAPFHAVSLEGSWTADVTVGKDTSVVLEGDADVLKHVKTEVSEGKLRVHEEHGWMAIFSHHDRLVAHITTPSLDAFTRSGSGDSTIAGVTGNAFTVELDGSGDIKASGSAGKLETTINGSGKADLHDLTADDAVVTINGSGDVTVQARQSLNGTVNGSGDIRYIGNPQVSSAIHGSGAVEKK